MSAIGLAAALAACGSGSAIGPDRQTNGIASSGDTGAGSSSINGGAGSSSIGGGAGGSSISGGAGTPILDGSGSSGQGGSGGSACGADSASCQALQAAFAGDGASAFDCSNTGYPQWTVTHYVTPDGSGQCAFRDGYIAQALNDCWAFHCTTSAANCAVYGADVNTQLCDAQQLCGGGSLGNDVCTTQAQLPCSAISCSQ